MQYLLSAREMKQIDKNTIEVFGVPSLVLMERAALRVVEVIKKEQIDAAKTLVVCGTGNNGGDGMAVARMLYLEGNSVEVWLIGSLQKCSEETKKQYDILQAYGVPVVEQKEGFCAQVCVQDSDLELAQTQTAYTLMIDALFGIGLSRNVEGVYREAIEEMNRLDGQKIAIDIPSGVHADSGAVMGSCFFADHTVTFAYNKTGLCLYPGADAVGKVHVAEIGITKESFLEKEPQMLMPQAQDLTRLPKRKADSNKGTYGKVLVIAGSEEMSGAAYFSAKAAYRSGCGLVKVFTHEKNRSMLTTRLPEAIPVTYDGKKNLKESLIAAVQWADVLVLGPGLGMSDTARQIVKVTIQTAAVPIVVDADALNLLSEELEILKGPHTDLIVTPHLGEMSRLVDMPIEYIKKNILMAAQDFSREYNVICVLKDARTITSIPYGKTYVNTSGNHGMATAGSGDVLTGIIAGFLAGGLTPEDAAVLGVYVHGLSGDAIVEKTGYYSLMAEDILDGIKEVLK